MNTQKQTDREQLIAQVLGARTLPQIAAAESALSAWIRDHPDDQGMTDGFEQLANMREIAEAKVADPDPVAA